MKQIVFDKLESIQADHDKIVWVSGVQMTQLLSKYNASSVRLALSLLAEEGKIRRERRAGRGPKGKTGQSSWYSSLSVDPYQAPNGPSKKTPQPSSKNQG